MQVNNLKNDSEERYNSFIVEVMKWCKELLEEHNELEFKEVKNKIVDYTKSNFVAPKGLYLTDKATNFINNEASGRTTITEFPNVYSKDGIDVEIGTVHSVKGETHSATLYLETEYKRHLDTERIANQLKGIPNTSKDGNVLQSLKIAYVGMSRPRYMLCYAIHKDRFKAIDGEQLRKLWDIDEKLINH